MTADEALRSTITTELAQHPSLDCRELVILVTRGVVKLAGVVGSFTEKSMLDKIIAQIPDVRAIANGVVVKYGVPSYRPDAEIAAAVADALQVSADIDLAVVNIRVAVAQGWVTLEGLVSAMRQRASAESAIIKLRGIRGVTNNIAIKRSATVIEAILPKGAVAYPSQQLSRLH